MADQQLPDLSAFRKARPVVAAPPQVPDPAQPAFVGITGTLPFAPGVAIRPTAGEQLALDRLGIKVDAVPGNLAEVIARAKASITPEAIAGLRPVDPGTPALHVVEKSIDDLSASQREAIVAGVRQMQATEARLAALPTIEGPAADAIRRAMMTIDADAPAPAPDPAPPARDEVGFYGTATAHKPQPRAALAPAPLGRIETLEGEVARLNEALDAALAKLPPPGSESPSGALGLGRCQHCGWDLGRPDETEPTEADKHAYLAMILGGEQVRFRKVVSLFGGHVTARFRTLTQAESELAHAQVAVDERAGKIADFRESTRMLLEYRLAMTLETLAVGAGLFTVPDATAVEPDEGDPTSLPILLRYLDRTVMPTDSLRRAISIEYASFNRLAEKMEVSAGDDPFWEGVASPA